MRRDKSVMQMNDMKTLRHLELIIDGMPLQPLFMQRVEEAMFGKQPEETLN